jgi:tetratricopeptide (TPR) repeat protein
MTRAEVAAVAGVAIGLAAAGVVLRASEVRHRPEPIQARLLYLRSGDTARRVMLSFDALAADVYWIRAIQHYGRDKKSDRVDGRFELLQPLLDLTTTLDPHFNVAYRFGAMFLSITPPQGPGRSDHAIALLEKGLAANPTRWQFAHDIGFVHYFYTKDFQEAARWFQRAAAMPGAPAWIHALAATTAIQGGDLEGAEVIYRELANSPETSIQEAARRGLAQLDALRQLDQLQQVVDRFRHAAGRNPTGWDDLVRSGHLSGVPADPSGALYVFDAPTATIRISPRSALSPLPKLAR